MEEQSTRRKERERQSRRNDIIAAAREVFTTRGFAEATLEEIALKAEYGKGTLYNYFEGKDDLYAAVIADCLDRCQSIAESAFADGGVSFQSASKTFSRNLLAFFYSNPGIVSLLMREMHMPQEHAQVHDRLAILGGIVERAMDRAIKAGELKPCPSDRLAFLLIAHIFTLFHNSVPHGCCLRNETPESIPQLNDHQIRSLTEEVIGLMDLTFYNGVLLDEQRQPAISNTLINR